MDGVEVFAAGLILGAQVNSGGGWRFYPDIFIGRVVDMEVAVPPVFEGVIGK